VPRHGEGKAVVAASPVDQPAGAGRSPSLVQHLDWVVGDETKSGEGKGRPAARSGWGAPGRRALPFGGFGGCWGGREGGRWRWPRLGGGAVRRRRHSGEGKRR